MAPKINTLAGLHPKPMPMNSRRYCRHKQTHSQQKAIATKIAKESRTSNNAIIASYSTNKNNCNDRKEREKRQIEAALTKEITLRRNPPLTNFYPSNT